MREHPKPMQRYRHFKGGIYQVLTLARDSETMREVVVYQALYGDYQIYVRPLAMFMSEVDRVKYPNAQQKFRFEAVDAEAYVKENQSEDKAETVQVSQMDDMTDDMQAGHAGSTVHFVQAAYEGNTAEHASGEAYEGNTAEHASGEAYEGNTAEHASGEAYKGNTAEHTTGEAQPQESEPGMDSAVMEFLEADSYGKKLNILASLRHRITDDMITTMAIASDLEVGDGPVQERYEQLKNCLLVKEKYECVRIR